MVSLFALPLAVIKLTAQNKYRKSNILFSSFFITSFINIILFVLIILFSKYFSVHILHEARCSNLIRILFLSLPVISVTSLIKAYYFGIENIKPVIFSNISEEIIKLILIIIFLPKIIIKGTLYATSFFLFITLFGEIFSFFTLSIFLPKNIKLKNLSYKYDPKCINNLIKISFPTLSGRIIGSIGYFFEPIILTNLLLYKGLSANYIRLNYGYFQGYIIPLLTIPSFFLSAISNNIVSLISKLKIQNKHAKIKKIISKILFLIFICGLTYSIILKIFGKKIMYLLYKNTNGYNYLIYLLPFFILFYLESPLLSVLQSLDYEKKVFKITTTGIIVKYLFLVTFIFFNLGFKSIILSEIINIIFVITISIYCLKKAFYHFSQQ